MDNMNNKQTALQLDSAEYRLLFLASVKDLSFENSLQIEKLLTEPIDWNLFLNIVEQHRIYPIVCHNLKKIKNCETMIPVLRKLEPLSKAHAFQSLKLSSDLISVVKLLENNQIRAISLKGPLLAQSIFGNIALRTSRDLDFLIDIDDLDKTIDLFVADGYRIEHFNGDLTAKKKHYLIKINHHFAFVKNGLTVEIHWNFHFLGYRCRFADLYNQSRIAKISGNEIHVLEQEDEFLYLVFHGSKHGWHRLKWLADIAEIIKKNQLDWQSLLLKCRQYDILHIFGQTMILVHHFYGIKIPVDAHELLKNKLAVKLSAMTVPIILGAPEESLVFKKYSLVLFKSWHKKMEYILSHFVPNHIDFEEKEIRDRWFFYYFLRRPFGKLRRLFTDKKTTEGTQR